jgi:hypothetical protein
MSKFNKGYPKSRFVSDRSGFSYPRSQLVVEKGTGLVVAKCEDDGRYNLVDHPQNKQPKVKPERMGLKNPRPQTGRYKDIILINDWDHSEQANPYVQYYEMNVPFTTEEGAAIVLEGYDPT